MAILYLPTATDDKLATAAWIKISGNRYAFAADEISHLLAPDITAPASMQCRTYIFERDESGPADNIHQKTVAVVQQDSAKFCSRSYRAKRARRACARIRLPPPRTIIAKDAKRIRDPYKSTSSVLQM